ncbi:MAG: class I SAM-dependent methyltransferase [candidate division NC10 bacterium]|nr:class I SAM-dependent methyltransferase [candidate division NC10 bacterium]
MHPLVWPVDLGPAELLQEGMATKYNQEQEIGYFSEQVKEGLDEIEWSLVDGPMAKRGRVLDVGCGGGREAIALAKLGYGVVGIDIASRMIETAQKKASQEALNTVFMTLPAHEVTQRLGSFDYVLTTPGFYQCIPTKELRIRTLQALASVLEPDGKLFLSAPWMLAGYRYGLRAHLVDWLRQLRRLMPGEVLVTEPGDRLLGFVSPVSDPKLPVFHHIFYRRETIEEEIRGAGLYGEPLRNGMWWQLRKK